MRACRSQKAEMEAPAPRPWPQDRDPVKGFVEATARINGKARTRAQSPDSKCNPSNWGPRAEKLCTWRPLGYGVLEDRAGLISVS